MKSITTLLFICTITFNTIAQNSYEKKMEAALNLHTAAKTFEDEKKSEKAYLDIAESENNWLAYYWASYIQTQLFNAFENPDTNPPQNVSAANILGKAQEHLDNARNLADKSNNNYLSDIEALQLLIYQFNIRIVSDADEQALLIEKMNTSLKKATLLNRENPLIFVILGTNMVGSTDKYSQLIAGRQLLIEADRLFKNRKIHRSLSTHFNEEWLGLFWLDFADKQLEKMGKS